MPKLRLQRRLVRTEALSLSNMLGKRCLRRFTFTDLCVSTSCKIPLQCKLCTGLCPNRLGYSE